MEWVKGLWRGSSAEPKRVSLSTTRPPSPVSLKGRETPIDLLEKGTFRLSHVAAAEYCVNPDRNLLTVVLPKNRNHKKSYQMEYYRTLDLLMDAIKEEMAFDEFETMDALQLASEYPFFFWNAMFHCLGRVHVFEKEMQERGVAGKGKRKRIKR